MTSNNIWSTNRNTAIFQTYLTDNADLNIKILNAFLLDLEQSFSKSFQYITDKNENQFMLEIHKFKQILAYLGFTEASIAWDSQIESISNTQTIHWESFSIPKFISFFSELQSILHSN